MADFIAYVDRTIDGTEFHVKIDVVSPGEHGDNRALFAGHAIGLLRSEVESTLSHIALMRAFQLGRTEEDKA